LFGRAYCESISAGTDDLSIRVPFGMNISFHDQSIIQNPKRKGNKSNLFF
jgi:hypothetical protein